MPNPYSYGPMVTDPAMFFGREAELDTLCTRLRNMQSTSILGLRRIGKSSLLYQLTQILRDELDKSYVPLYIDLQDARYRTVTGFVQTIIRELNTQVGGILTVNDVTDMQSFTEMIEQLSNTGIRPVLCLDEFEEFMQHHKEFDNDFLEALRALGARSWLALVTASRMSLFELIQTHGLTSPFHNIFSQIDLGALKPDAAQALRRAPFESENITLSQEDETLVKELGGRHPFYLQMACYYLYEVLPQSQDTRASVVRGSFSRDAEPHFERLWNHLHANEKAALKVVVGQAVPTTETENRFQQLERLGLVERADGNWKIFSAAFAERVRQYSIQLPKPLEERPKPEPEVSSVSNIPPILLYAGVATAVVIIAVVLIQFLPTQKIPSLVVIVALILPFALVGAGKMTGHDYTEILNKLLELIRS